MFRLSRLRLIEIGVAIVLTMVALLFVAWTVWAAEPGGIDVTDAWARPTIGQGRSTAAYLTITNKGDQDDVLQAARSDQAKSVELHQTMMTADGVMQMRPVEGGVAIAAGAALELAPGGTHVMIMGLDEALAEGDALKLTLDFAKAGPVEIVVPVRAGAAGAHAHH